MIANLLLALLLVSSPAAATGAASEPQGTSSMPGTIRGEASWYDDGPGLYGAVHSYRFGDPRYRVRVCRRDNRSVCVTVTVRDHMANRVRAIDLSPSAFHALWPGLTRREALIGRGVVQVIVTTGGGPQPTLPATDTAP